MGTEPPDYRRFASWCFHADWISSRPRHGRDDDSDLRLSDTSAAGCDVGSCGNGFPRRCGPCCNGVYWDRRGCRGVGNGCCSRLGDKRLDVQPLSMRGDVRKYLCQGNRTALAPGPWLDAGHLWGGLILASWNALVPIDSDVSLLMLSLGGIALVVSGFVWLSIMIRCPRCQARIFWRAIAGEPLGSWYDGLLGSTCPACRYDPRT